jgi:hypothetical protein
MNNIVDTFNISKINIESEIEDEIDDENENNIDSINENTDIIIKKKKLIEMVNNLTNIEYIEILNIIQNDKCSYSSNSNGVFINLTNIDDKTIDKIFNFLKFTKHKKEELKEKEKYLETFKDNMDIPDIDKNINKKFNELNNKNNESIECLSENSDNINYNDYLCFSSDDEDNK